MVGSLLVVVCSIVANLVAPDYGWRRFDEPPFFSLQGFVMLNAFVISTTVLIRQNRVARLAEHHAHLELQVNPLTEEKSSKIIALLEQLRRGMPGVADAVDPEARDMARPADARAVLTAIEHERASVGGRGTAGRNDTCGNF